jgi:phosphoserine phosphatase
MSNGRDTQALVARDMKAILDVATALATPFDLATMLSEVIVAAKQVLDADRGSVWLYDAAADELVLEIATDMRTVRIPAGTGLVGSCARHRRIINVPDCYADPRFDPAVDRESGYRTRCMLTLPLVDHKGVLVGVMQVLNKRDGVFDAKDEALATALAAQCAVALQRVRMTEALIDGERMRQELEMARLVQLGTLPATMPGVAGYGLHGSFEPAELTGGDTFDVSLVGSEILVMLADATGHGIAPALSVTQLQAMLRIALGLGTDLDTTVVQVNNQLADWLADDRFITAFVGLLDPVRHTLRYHSAGQAPILLYQAAAGGCALYKPTSFPLGAMRLARLRPATELALGPGDILVLLSDGIYEYEDPAGEDFGVDRVRDIVRMNRWRTARGLAEVLLGEVRRFARGAPQQDDITIVIVKRESGASEDAHFATRIDAVDDVVAFTAGFFAREGIDDSLRMAVDLTLEELFTNMVKYGGSDSPVMIRMSRIDGGIEVAIAQDGVGPFDVTAAPDVDVTRPIAQREPGGLGLHLIRRLVDSIDYRYVEESRRSLITFRKAAAPQGPGDDRTRTGGDDAAH